MAPERTVRALALAMAGAPLLALAGCGSAAPGALPSRSGSAAASATPTPSSVVTTGGPTDGAYPGDAAGYSAAALAALSATDSARLLELSNPELVASLSALAGRPGPWTFTDCQDGGATDSCHYFNPAGNFAEVGVDPHGLGRRGAVTALTIDDHTFPTDAQQYLGEFLTYWISESNAGTHPYATDDVIESLVGAAVPLAANTYPPTPCGAGRVCLDGGDYPIYHFVIRTDRLGQSDAILEMTT